MAGHSDGQQSEAEHDGQVALLEWFQKYRLARHMEAITDVNGFGILSLEELCVLTSDDVTDIMDTVQMNMGERTRFSRAVKKLQEEMQERNDRATLREAEMDDDGEEGATRGGGGAAGAPGEDGAKEGELRRRLRELQEVLKEEAGSLGSGELEALERGLEAARNRIEDIATKKEQDGPPEDGYDVGPDDPDIQWFQVVKNLAFVKKGPSKDADSCGLMRNRQLVQVKKERTFGADGKEWVELTPLQLLSCDTEDPWDRGFMLIDGAHLGLGLILRGPLTFAQRQQPDEQSKPQQPQQPQQPSDGSRKDGEEMDPDMDRRQEDQRQYAQYLSFQRQKFLERLELQAARQSQKIKPKLIMESTATGLRIAVHYRHVTGTVKIFETFLEANNSVWMLRQRLCAATGLKAHATVLMTPGNDGKLPGIDSSIGMMLDEKTIKSYGLAGPDAIVYLSYTGHFEKHYLGGALSPDGRGEAGDN